MTDSRPPQLCWYYLPGHRPHWIQVNLAGKDGGKPLPGRLLDVGPDGSVDIEVQGQELHLWNHESDRLAEAAQRVGGALSYQSRWGLLWIPSESGRYAFCVARRSDQLSPCPTRAPEGTLTELLKEAGGFTLPIGELGIGPG